MKKAISVKIATITIVLSAIICSIFLFSGCINNTKDPVYEMKLFDDDWNEVEMTQRSDGDFYVEYRVKYDRTIKGLNAICYKDGQQIYRYEYKNGFVQDNMVAVWSQFNGAGWGITDFPSVYGHYRITYTFDRGLGSGGILYNTPVGRIYGDELPKTMYRVSMYIYTE